MLWQLVGVLCAGAGTALLFIYIGNFITESLLVPVGIVGFITGCIAGVGFLIDTLRKRHTEVIAAALKVDDRLQRTVARIGARHSDEIATVADSRANALKYIASRYEAVLRFRARSGYETVLSFTDRGTNEQLSEGELAT